MQSVAAHPSTFDLQPSDFVEFNTPLGVNTEPFPTLPDGSAPSVVAVQCGTDEGYTIAFGDSSIDASTDPFMVIAEGTDPVYVNVSGKTHWSVNNTTGQVGAVMIAPLGDD